MSDDNMSKPLLVPGNEAEWARLNEEKGERMVKFARSLSMSECLELGQKLCTQAFGLYRAVHFDGDAAIGSAQGCNLHAAIVDAGTVGLENVIVGGFAVAAHGCFNTRLGIDLLVPDGPETDEAILRFCDRIGATRLKDGAVPAGKDIAGVNHLSVDGRHGVIDIMRGGLPPLDYETVASRAVEAVWRNSLFRVASLESIVGFKRLAGRGQDRVDLENLERINGELPHEPIPGLDD